MLSSVFDCKMLSGAAGMLAGNGVGVQVLLMAYLFHTCMVGSISGGFASSACFQMQHCNWLSVHLVETIHSLGGRYINFGAETILAFAAFIFHILNRTSDIVAASSYP